MSPELLTKIGEFELKEKLGQGGYGAVYKARDSLGRLSSVRQTERYDSRIVDIQSQSWHQVISGIEKERSPRTRM